MSDDRESTRKLTNVLESHLGDAAGWSRAAAWPGARLRALLVSAVAGQRRRVTLDAEVRDVLTLAGVEAGDLDRLTADVVRLLDRRGESDGLALNALPTLAQAYSRGAARVVAAESHVLRDELARAQPADRSALLDGMLRALLPLGAHGFEALRRRMLFDALAAGFGEPSAGTDAPATMAIAMVDLVGSTNHLVAASVDELERLVDALFAAGQLATAGREAHVVKHVGDGLFLAGHDTAELATVALDVLDRLERALPLRARGGLAHGTVLERAGDVFGLPVNTAVIASKAARPGTLLAEEAAARRVPTAMRGRLRTVDLPHPALGATRVATLRHTSARD